MNTEAETPIVSAQTIRESPLGLDLGDAQCRTLAEAAGAVCLEKGAMLLEEGHSDDTLYVVVSGRLEVIKPTGGGDTITLQLLHAGDMAGILGFVDGVPHSAAIRALDQCELIALDRKDLEMLIAKDPQLVYQVMRAVVRAAHRILGRMNAQFVEMTNYITKQHGRY
jgi:CRP-like cAMP-binding protein